MGECKCEKGCCCKKHRMMKGIAMIIIAAAIVAIDQGYLKISYPILVAIVLVVMGLKKLVIGCMCGKKSPKKKGKK